MRLAVSTSFALSVVFVAVITLAMHPLQAQTLTVLHTFTAGQDGAEPYAGLTMDHGGNLYGTALGGGCGFGTAFKMTKRNGAWLLNPLYCFSGGNDGNAPIARVVFGPNGSLYGTTQFGGGDGCYDGFGCGTVFSLRPPATACKTSICPWSEMVLYRFSGGTDGAEPGYGDLIFDTAGNIYGTAREGGTGCNGNGCGVVFKLMPSQGGGWTESVIYTFTGGQDGVGPQGGLIFDSVGNLYGTTYAGGSQGGGTVFELTPNGSNWTEATLYAFDPSAGDGFSPHAGLVFDAAGNLYGTTPVGAGHGGGTVFELTPHAGGNWTEEILYSFSSNTAGPYAPLTFDAAGNLYGTTYGSGANQLGSVFKLTSSNGSWSYSSLHDFTGGSDGTHPFSPVVLDANGNVYGTAAFAGNLNCNAPNGCGVVWEITQ